MICSSVGDLAGDRLYDNVFLDDNVLFISDMCFDDIVDNVMFFFPLLRFLY